MVEFRKKNNFTMTEAAKYVGIPFKTWQGYEKKRRRPPLRIMCIVAKELNIPIEQAFEWVLQRENNIKK